MARTYTLDELNVIFSKFEETDWEAISTPEFLEFLRKEEEKSQEEEATDHGSEADQAADYGLEEEVSEG